MGTTDNTTPAAAPMPTTQQLLAALASALLPLAGPTGVAVSALVPAVQALYDRLTNHPTENFTVEDLVAIVQEGDEALASLKGHVAALSPGKG
jgi:hypothetical protein